MLVNNNYMAKQEKYFLGTHINSGKKVYLNMPEWTYSKISGISYWKFGYLSLYYNLDSHINTDKDLYDELLEHYELDEKIKDNLGFIPDYIIDSLARSWFEEFKNSNDLTDTSVKYLEDNRVHIPE